jgi:hypothetical protein
MPLPKKVRGVYRAANIDPTVPPDRTFPPTHAAPGEPRIEGPFTEPYWSGVDSDTGQPTQSVGENFTPQFGGGAPFDADALTALKTAISYLLGPLAGQRPVIRPLGMGEPTRTSATPVQQALMRKRKKPYGVE